jgi:putative glycosyltransferase (TIGR04372 family)
MNHFDKKKIYKYIHITPLFYAIGNAGEEILWAYKRAQLEGKKLHIVAPYPWTQMLGYKVCNRAIFKVVGDFIEEDGASIWLRFTTLIVNILFVVKRFSTLMWRTFCGRSLGEEWNFPHLGKRKYWPTVSNKDQAGKFYADSIHKIMEKPHEISLNSFDYDKCLAKLNAYGLDLLSKKYICLHVRDTGYYNDPWRRTYRNADIDNYSLALDYLINKGYYVVRLGDPKTKPLSYYSDLVLDYPFLALRSPEMDLFLTKCCSFFIGMQSGMNIVAELFDKPILQVNMYEPFFCAPLKSIDRGLLKKAYYKDSEKPLSLSEWFNLPFKYMDYRSLHSDSDIIFKENDPQEILEAVKRFVVEFESGFSVAWKDDMVRNYQIYRDKSDEIISSNELMWNDVPTEVSRRVLRSVSTRGVYYDI